MQSQIYVMEEDRAAYEATIQSLREELEALRVDSSLLQSSHQSGQEVSGEYLAPNNVTNDHSTTFTSFGHLALGGSGDTSVSNLVDSSTSPWTGGPPPGLWSEGGKKTAGDDNDGNDGGGSFALSPIKILPEFEGKISPTAELRSFHKKNAAATGETQGLGGAKRGVG